MTRRALHDQPPGLTARVPVFPYTSPQLGASQSADRTGKTPLSNTGPGRVTRLQLALMQRLTEFYENRHRSTRPGTVDRAHRRLRA